MTTRKDSLGPSDNHMSGTIGAGKIFLLLLGYISMALMFTYVLDSYSLSLNIRLCL